MTPDRSAMPGTKSSPMPSTAHEPALPTTPLRVYSARIEPTGSASTKPIRGSTLRKKRVRPVIVPAEPTPTTTASSACPICAQISGPVPVSCASGLAGLLNWSAKKAPGMSRARCAAQVLVVVGMSLADIAAGDVHLRAERLQVQHLFRGHLVRHHQHDTVAFGARDQREAEAGVAGGRLDHRAAGLQPAVALGGLDHRHADAILDRAARVLRLELQEQLAAAGVEARHLDQRRVADEAENRGTHLGFHALHCTFHQPARAAQALDLLVAGPATRPRSASESSNEETRIDTFVTEP